MKKDCNEKKSPPKVMKMAMQTRSIIFSCKSLRSQNAVNNSSRYQTLIIVLRLIAMNSVLINIFVIILEASKP